MLGRPITCAHQALSPAPAPCPPCRRGASWRNLPADYADYVSYELGGTGERTGSGGIFKTAAIAILQQERRPMTSGDITKLALERKLVKCTGKTPENTMASALYTEVRKRPLQTPFIK